MSRTVAIFGGSFNPPHLAHQMVCLVALETAAVDEVWMLPTYRHAFGKELAPFDDRVEMCRLAARAFGGRVTVDPIERDVAGDGARADKEQAGVSRTFHTLTALAARHPGTAFRLLVGEDILAEKHLWYRWDDVVRLAPPIVVGRDGAPQSPQSATQTGFDLPGISSSDVRARIARGETAVPLVSRAVMDYIAGRGLYR
ncbi:MAG TPA: nicotinate-nicotinamide nucleotide adenylyltransferase [Kofleriaceae bacterium]|nr:nicotinate-nicotinamide nucleotide adenylyltransferase [Kofleriaceae bacterium]